MSLKGLRFAISAAAACGRRRKRAASSLPACAKQQQCSYLMYAVTGFGRHASTAPSSFAPPAVSSSDGKATDEQLLVWVKLHGDVDYTLLRATPYTLLGQLKIDIGDALKLRGRLSQVTLRLAEQNGEFRPQLDVRKTLEAAGVKNGSCIVVSEEPERDSSAGRALTQWRQLLTPVYSIEEVHAMAAEVAACALKDARMTLDEQARAWGTPIDRILQRPLPYDTTNKAAPAVLLELLDAADVHSNGLPPLYERVWKKLQQAFVNTTQRRSIVLLTGVSGAGKTKAAFDVGRKYAFMVVARVWEQGLTPAWQLLREVMVRLREQGGHRLGTRSKSTAAGNANSAVAAIVLLLSCHLEWAAMVYTAARGSMDGVVAETAAREAVLRAQRNGLGYRCVHALFASRLLHVLEDQRNVSGESDVILPLATGLQRLHALRAQIPSHVPIVWCYDEVQVLLTDTGLDGFFAGSYDNVSSPTDISQAATDASIGPNDGVTDTGMHPRFPALREDVQAVELEARRAASPGWFYGLLVAIRRMQGQANWAHLLCGSSLRLNQQLLQQHSPAQGICTSIDADTHLDEGALRTWFASYMTPAAVHGLDPALLGQLIGRPLFASCLFRQLYSVRQPADADPASMVRTALQQAVNDASTEARDRVAKLWASTFVTTSGEQPHALVAWLFFLQRMGWGTTSTITPPSMSAEVMEAVQRGVLHVRRDSQSIDVAQEPITAAAITAVGDLYSNQAIQGSAPDAVVRALVRRATGTFGDTSSKGATAEDIIAWRLLCRARDGPVSLRHLFAPFLRSSLDLFPPGLNDHTVCLHQGVACSVALGSSGARRSFLDLLAGSGGDRLLLHHTQQSAAGADLAFLVQRPGESAEAPPRQRLVIMQLKNSVKAAASDMLDAVNLGRWYPDDRGETASHKALREVLDAHPDWADPVRVLVSARPWAEQTQQTAAWVNHAKVPQQPIVLLQFTQENVGVDLLQDDARAELHPPKNSLAWWPTPVRHWPTNKVHPQASLLAMPQGPVNLLPSLRVRFKGKHLHDLEREAAAGGRHTVIRESQHALLVEYERLDDAFRVVAAAKASVLCGPSPVHAEFAH